MTPPAFRLLAHIGVRTSESPVWDDRRGRLFFVGLHEGVIASVALDGSDLRQWQAAAPVGSIGLTDRGRLIAALPDRAVLFDPETGAFEDFVAMPEQPPMMRMNDGKVGPDGAFWVGSTHQAPVRLPIGVLYRIGPDRSVRAVREGLGAPNGLAWSPDGRTMYASDSRLQVIDRCAFDPATGACGPFARIATPDAATGRPDGAACDAEGFYWSAGVSAGVLNRFDGLGRITARWPVPTERPTMPCFCGEGLRMLAVTSLRPIDTAEPPSPEAGAVFVAASPVAGAPVARFPERGA